MTEPDRTAADSREGTAAAGWLAELRRRSPSGTAAASTRPIWPPSRVGPLGAERVLAVIGRSASYPESQWARRARRRRGDRPRGARDRHRRAQRSALRREPVQPLLLLQDRALVARRSRRARARDCRRCRRDERRRPARPPSGRAAAREHGVVSPLAMFEFSKAEIRERSRAHGAADVASAVVALPVVAHSIWNAGDGWPAAARRSAPRRRCARWVLRATSACATSDRSLASSSGPPSLIEWSPGDRRAPTRGRGPRRGLRAGRARPAGDSAPARSTSIHRCHRPVRLFLAINLPGRRRSARSPRRRRPSASPRRSWRGFAIRTCT